MQVQRDWYRTYDALAALPPTVGATALRQRLLLLSSRVVWHPHWSTARSSPAARVELRRQARALETVAV
jgi:hypothetical protein